MISGTKTRKRVLTSLKLSDPRKRIKSLQTLRAEQSATFVGDVGIKFLVKRRKIHLSTPGRESIYS